MALIEVNRAVTPSQVRQFAVIWLPGFCFVMALAAANRSAAWSTVIVLVVCGILSIALGITRPAWMRRVFIAWMWAVFPIGWLLSHLLRAAIYYLVITPIGLVMRAAGHNPLALKIEPRAETYWSPRRQEPDPASYFRQF